MERRLDAIVDVMRVPVDGDPGTAVLPVGTDDSAVDLDCEVLVAGGGTGGVAAALAAARRGADVCLLEETDWLGGQFTAQGVSALDEHDHIETAGGTASYYELRERLRAHYRTLAGISGTEGTAGISGMPDTAGVSGAAGRSGMAGTAGTPGSQPQFNPGRCWVTRLAFEPAVAQRVLEEMLRPYVDAGRLRIFRRMKVVAVTREADRIESVVAMPLEGGEHVRFRPQIVIDATELGDLLPLAGAAYRVGAETLAETGEAHAQPQEPKPHCVQSFTYTFALERDAPGTQHIIPTPRKYTHYRAGQPYSLTIEVHGGEIYGETSGWLEYDLFRQMPGTKGGLWTYRRLLSSALFGARVPRDVTLVNWPGNDYRDQSLIDRPPLAVAAALQDAKLVSLGFLHWLQTEAPADGRRGAPELALRPDVMGTRDGLCKFPYIRESRRIVARRTVVEQDVSAHFQPGPRAAHFADSVGIGWYPIDIHRAGPEDVGVSCRTRPFQIPLGALVPVVVSNLVAGAKNIGVTHITNGCYRLHPVEWNIGEAAGALAAFALEQRTTAAGVLEGHCAGFQRTLLAEGVPLAWVSDVAVGHPAFAAIQRLAMRQLAGSDLRFEPDGALDDATWKAWGGNGPAPATRAEGAMRLAV